MKQSLADRIAEAVIADHLRGRGLGPGDRLPSMRELQREYSASSTTILHALSVLEVRGLVEKRQGSGCYVKQLDTEPRSGSASLVGLVVQSRAYELMMRIYKGVDGVCRANGYHVVLGDADWSYEREREEVARMVDLGCRSVILVPGARTRQEMRADYLKSEYRDYPIVLVDLAHPEQGRSQVVFDNYRAGYELTERLLAEGHRHVAFMEGTNRARSLVHKSNCDRKRGYLAAYAAAGLQPREADCWVTCHDTAQEQIAEYVRRCRHQPDAPTAVIALEDKAAMHAISVALDAGISVHRDLRVVGFDNLDAGRSFRPAFTTTGQDYVSAGELAADMALQHVSGALERPFAYVLPMPVIRWEAGALCSTAPPARASRTRGG